MLFGLVQSSFQTSHFYLLRVAMMLSLLGLLSQYLLPMSSDASTDTNFYLSMAITLLVGLVVVGIASFWSVLSAVFWPFLSEILGIFGICRLSLAQTNRAIMLGSLPYNRYSALESRSIPNRRLIKAFAIDNAFTTFDRDYKTFFHKSAARMLRLSPGAWTRVATNIRSIVAGQVDTNATINLSQLVQSLSLKITLSVFFGLDVTKMSQVAVMSAAQEINWLWIASKLHKSDDEISSHRAILFEALSTLMPNSVFAGQLNPLNFILPAYETLWRIVGLAFVEICFHNKSGTPRKHDPAGDADGWIRALIALIEEAASSGNVKLTIDHAGLVAPVDIAKEALRLYPSTQNVHRAVAHTRFGREKTRVAHVQMQHTIAEVWGDTANFFNPARFSSMSEEQMAHYTPFGVGSLRCPARFKYAHTIIALLLAGLVEGFHDGWTLETGFELGLNSASHPLPSGRKDLAEWMLTKIDSSEEA